MRIIGGQWRGRKLDEPRGREVTRPTTDRVREAMASMVLSAFDFDLSSARVLDAFAGSGALGIEMLSRGAQSLVSCDSDRGAAQLVRKNLESLKCPAGSYRVVQGDVLKQAERGRIFGGPFNLVLLDPPYALGPEPVAKLLEDLARGGILAPGAYVVYEHAAETQPAAPAGFALERQKSYGITAVDLLHYENENLED